MKGRNRTRWMIKGCIILCVALVLGLLAFVLDTLERKEIFYSSASDGWVQHLSWNNYVFSHDAATASDKVYRDFIYIGCGQRFAVDPADHWVVKRAFLFFDTSSLEPDFTIKQAFLEFYGQGDFSDADFDIIVQKVDVGDQLEREDFNFMYYYGNGGSFNTSNFSTTSYNTLALNKDGRSWINKGEVTVFCLRSSKDVNSEEPIGDEWVDFYSHENAMYKPKLVVIGR